MSEVKRYVTTCDCMSEASWGEYVRHADYDALAAECELLRGTLAAAQRVTLAVCDERDAALAELAALKGGREAVAFVCEASSTHHGCPEGYGDILSEWLPAGTELYTAPPAQASAWVPEDLRARCAEILDWQKTGVLAGNALRSFAAAKHYAGDHSELLMAESDTAREAYAAILAAPTPGASEGKGGEK